METKTPVTFEYQTVSLYEAVIINKNPKAKANTITANDINELETRINVWIKCGNFEVDKIVKVERQQIKIA